MAETAALLGVVVLGLPLAVALVIWAVMVVFWRSNERGGKL